MPEIKVTHLVREVDCSEFFASVFERGENVGPETWANALEAAKEAPLLKGKEFDEARDWLRGFGAWDEEELRLKTDDEIGALVLQFIAGDIREMESLYSDDPEGYRAAQEAGEVSGYLSLGDDGEWYFYLGD